MNLHNRQNAHHDIDHIFKDLLPIHSMPERPEQIVLSHRMLDAMLDSEIALCDAGTGIGPIPIWWPEQCITVSGPLRAIPPTPF